MPRQEQHLKGDGASQPRGHLAHQIRHTEAELWLLIVLESHSSHAGYLGSDYFEDATHPIHQGSSELAFTKGVQGRQQSWCCPINPRLVDADLDLTVSYNAGTGDGRSQLWANDNQGMLRVDMDGRVPVFFQIYGRQWSCGYSDAKYYPRDKTIRLRCRLEHNYCGNWVATLPASSSMFL